MALDEYDTCYDPNNNKNYVNALTLSSATTYYTSTSEGSSSGYPCGYIIWLQYTGSNTIGTFTYLAMDSALNKIKEISILTITLLTYTFVF
jgi:hypothetical protein